MVAQSFIDEVKRHHPIEVGLLKLIVKATNKAHDPIIWAGPPEGWDNGDADNEPLKAGDLGDIERIAFNLDFVRFELASGRWIDVVNGEREDYISNYSSSLESLMAPILETVGA